MDARLKKKISALPTRPGVYKFKNVDGEIIYIGKSVRLRDRVKSYFALNGKNLGEKTRRLVLEISDLETVETDSEIEALLLEAELIKEHKPVFNIQWKDDKSYKYIEIKNAGYRKRNGIRKTIASDLWPVVTTSRKQLDKNSLYFGPFPQGRTVNQVLKVLRRIFPYCKYASRKVLEREKRPCFYYHIRLCPGICADAVSLEEYWKNIDQLVLFMRGKKKQVVNNYEKKMIETSEKLEYEKAAYYRDAVERLTYVTQHFHDANEFIENPNLKQDLRQEEITNLCKVLHAAGMTVPYDPEKDFYVEGYDISNLGKDFTVGSQVVFANGEPDKSKYRRYKIAQSKLPNDFAAMAEVLTRRIRKKDFPDLILIDGGKGQVSSVLEVFGKKNINVPVIGLAKKEEMIVVPFNGGFKAVRIARNAPALRLLMRIRDESHRFAQAYHKLLRKKALVN